MKGKAGGCEAERMHSLNSQETERRAGRKSSTKWDKREKAPAKKYLSLKWN